MALSDELEALAKRHGALSFRNRTNTQNPAFVFSVTGLDSLLAEVRQQDDALILQLVEAMGGVKALNMGGELALWTAEFDRLLSAITAARARLEGKP